MRTKSGFLLAFALLVTGVGAQVPADPLPAVRRIDHIMIRAGNPSDVYGMLADTLQLPVAWPLSSPREGVATGGVGVGNVNLEAIRFPGQTEQQPRLLGVALEPSPLDEAMRQLSLRGLAVGKRREIAGMRSDGSRGVLWTNVTLREFSDADNPADGVVHVFLSEYSPAYVDVEGRRARLRQQLVASGGGPLGIVDVKEVVVGVTDLASARRLWQRLLEPSRVAGPDEWRIGDGPALRLVPAEQNRVEALVMRVASLDRARTFLRDRGLLGQDAGGHITIASSALGSVELRLVPQ